MRALVLLEGLLAIEELLAILDGAFEEHFICLNLLSVCRVPEK